MEEPNVKKKHLGTVSCPACGVQIEIIEREEIAQPSQKKVSTKTLEASKTVQKQLK